MESRWVCPWCDQPFVVPSLLELDHKPVCAARPKEER